jgi:hypothetical protein
MSTLGVLKANIATLLRRTDLDAEIAIAVARAIQHYEREVFTFNETRSTSLTTTASTKTVTLPTDFVRADKLLITVNNAVYEVLPAPGGIGELEALYFSSSNTGPPSLHAIYAGAFYLYPIPDQTYTLTLDYVKRLTAFSSDSDSNSWTTDAEELIEARAMWWLQSQIIHDNDAAQASQMREMMALGGLRREATLRASSGRLRAHG